MTNHACRYTVRKYYYIVISRAAISYDYLFMEVLLYVQLSATGYLGGK